MSFDSRTFRNALGCFPTGVSIVTTVAANDAPVGVTISSFTSVSLDPPLILFCLDKGNPHIETFRTCGRFAVNVLSCEQQVLSVAFGSSFGNQWQGVEFARGEGGVPVLDGCLSNFECSTDAIHEGGDHLIFVGRVERLRCSSSGRPLIYFRGAYAALA